MLRASAFVCLAAAALAAGTAGAHCDTMNGPLVPEAQAALEKGDIAPILKWVQARDEGEIRAAFAEAVAVRGKAPEAKALADRWFLETLVRVHRAGEGAPYTGLKDEAPPPIVVMSDAAVAAGNADELIRAMQGHMGGVIREKFDALAAAKKEKDKSVEAGRAYVAAYVTFTHLVEGIHDAFAPAHGHDHATSAP
jgi:hypothetical protein